MFPCSLTSSFWLPDTPHPQPLFREGEGEELSLPADEGGSKGKPILALARFPPLEAGALT